MKKTKNNQKMTFRSAAEVRALERAERRVKKSGLGRIIASRVLQEENAPDDESTVVLGAPRRVEADHWICPYRIEGIVESDIEYSYGVDALQALLLALAGIRRFLDRTKRNFFFFGHDHGIPRQIPMGYGKAFEERVERAIDREWKRVEFAKLRQRKAEIAAAEVRLSALRRDVALWPQPSKMRVKSEIARQKARIEAAKKSAQSWETNLRK